MFFSDIVSPVGMLRLASDGMSITGLWLEKQKYFAAGLDPEAEPSPDLPVFHETITWLEAYFTGKYLPSLPPLAPRGSEFRQAVWKQLLEIPYGHTQTYGELAEKLNSSPRAIGNAVGHNPISILIPCHRVLGSGGSLTGYAGGVEKKRFLLNLEQAGLPLEGTAAILPEAKTSLHPQISKPAEEAAPVAKKYPCPCCGFLTLPVPREDALAFICPVCFWENDVFDCDVDQPSDENHGMTLNQARESFQESGAVRREFRKYVRRPLPEDFP